MASLRHLKLKDLQELVARYPGDKDLMLEILYEARNRAPAGDSELEARLFLLLGTGSDWSSAQRMAQGHTSLPEVSSLRTDELQDAVILASPDDRLLVNAPPGTGKTFVATCRVERLLEEGVTAGRIWVVSFTRTAVTELRKRVSAVSERMPDAAGVEVSTLDSEAWQLVRGLTGSVNLGSDASRQRTIQQATRLFIEGNPDALRWARRFRHLVIDEAQDVIGERAEFVTALLDAVDTDCGVTVLTDDAQAIYGSTDEDNGDLGVASLPQRIRRSSKLNFREVTLHTVHRSASQRLKSFFVNDRAELLSGMEERAAGLKRLIEDRIRAAAEPLPVELADVPSDQTLILFRYRFSVMSAASSIMASGESCRVRMSGTPTCIHPWVAVLFGGIARPVMTPSEFEGRWSRVAAVLGDQAPDAQSTWRFLEGIAGVADGISIEAIRAVAGGYAPPPELTVPELGFAGPIVSTIHASKGREADWAHLHIHQSIPRNSTDSEEARVLFVGASRARRGLFAGLAREEFPRRLASGRKVGGGVRGDRLTIEIGWDNDVDVFAHVSPDSCEFEDALAAQESMLAAPCRLRRLSGRSQSNRRIPLLTEEGSITGFLSTNLGEDLDEARRTDTLRVPRHFILRDIWSPGTRSVVLTPGDSREQTLHDAWRRSPFWLAPITIGLARIEEDEE